jgi:undecaprenyl-diphosphatase
MALPPQTVTLPARGWPIDPRKALIVSVLCWAGFLLMVWLVTTGRTNGIDEAGLLFWRHDHGLHPAGPPWLLEVVRDVTAFGGFLLIGLLTLAAIVALLFLRLRREAMLLLLTVVGGRLVEYGMKLLFGRPRPEIVPHLTEVGGASFPSGHSFNSAVAYIAVALAFATLSTRESVRLTIVGAAIVLSLLVAWSRVWLGVHFPSDVVAGWLGGAGWAFLSAALLRRPAEEAADIAAAERHGPGRD